MNTKLMKRTIFTRTGHKTLQCFSILFLLFVTSSCDLFRSDVIEEYNYLISVKNETNDTLLISIYRGGFISEDHLRAHIIYPNDSKKISSRRMSKEDDPVTKALHEWRLLDSCWLYKCDSNLIIVQNRDSKAYYPNRENLVATWAGPFRYMNDSINNFFNYNSWKSWLEPYYQVADGYVQFTIYESDLQGN